MAAGSSAAPGRTGPAAHKKEDGRTRRSASTRRAVAEAYLDLVTAGEMRPSARAVAEAAGVSERAVFRHYQDMESLHMEAAMTQIQRVSEEVPEPAPVDGPLAARIAQLARRWCVLHERVTPVRRVALLHEPFSPEIARRLSWIRAVLCTEVESTFAAELPRDDQGRRSRQVAALSSALSWETWNELRLRHELDPDAAAATVESMVTALLAFPFPAPVPARDPA